MQTRSIRALCWPFLFARPRLKEQYPDSAVGDPVISEPFPPLDMQFRLAVSVMLVNGVGQVFVGKRVDMIEEAWQMPQGGIDGDEAPIIAAMRELQEEVGAANVEVVAEFDQLAV